jgi:hypothetical protein
VAASPPTASSHEVVTIETVGQAKSVLADSWRAYPFNLAELRAVSRPCGFDRSEFAIRLARLTAFKGIAT